MTPEELIAQRDKDFGVQPPSRHTVVGEISSGGTRHVVEDVVRHGSQNIPRRAETPFQLPPTDSLDTSKKYALATQYDSGWTLYWQELCAEAE